MRKVVMVAIWVDATARAYPLCLQQGRSKCAMVLLMMLLRLGCYRGWRRFWGSHQTSLLALAACHERLPRALASMQTNMCRELQTRYCEHLAKVELAKTPSCFQDP